MVAENFYFDENANKGYFFYPFVNAGKNYKIQFRFIIKPEPVDDEGFVLPFQEDDTLGIIENQVRAGSKARGEVYLRGEWNEYSMEIDPECNITYFEKPTFVNEYLLNEYDWAIEIPLMEGIGWNHGDERRTKWYCAVKLSEEDFANATSKNLRDLEMSFGYGYECEHDHPIDFVCTRAVLVYEYEGKEYRYQWGGFAKDIVYPPEGWEEDTDASDYDK